MVKFLVGLVVWLLLTLLRYKQERKKIKEKHGNEIKNFEQWQQLGKALFSDGQSKSAINEAIYKLKKNNKKH